MPSLRRVAVGQGELLVSHSAGVDPAPSLPRSWDPGVGGLRRLLAVRRTAHSAPARIQASDRARQPSVTARAPRYTPANPAHSSASWTPAAGA